MKVTKRQTDNRDSSLWPMTDASQVKRAGDAVGVEVKPLEELYLKYQRPLRVHLLGKFRSFPLILNHAEDLLQDFALDKILAKGWLPSWVQRRGRFRDFLRTSLTNFVWDWWKKQPAYKTWVQNKHQQEYGTTHDEKSTAKNRFVDFPPDLPAPEPDTEQFNLSWAQTVIAETLDRLEQACRDRNRPQPGDSHIWEVFRLRTLDPIFKDTEPTPYEELVKTLGLRSPTEGTNMLLSAKRKFRRHLEDVISEYSGRDQPAKSELQVLRDFVESLAKKKAKNQ